jgi:hypothetical protein
MLQPPENYRNMSNRAPVARLKTWCFEFDECTYSRKQRIHGSSELEYQMKKLIKSRLLIPLKRLSAQEASRVIKSKTRIESRSAPRLDTQSAQTSCPCLSKYIIKQSSRNA